MSRHTGLTTVYVAAGLLRAQVIEAKLKQAGLSVLLDYESLGPIYGITVDGLGAVRVMVPDEQADEAQQLIENEEESETAG